MSRGRPCRHVRLAGMSGTIHGLGYWAHGRMKEVRIERNIMDRFRFLLRYGLRPCCRGLDSRLRGNDVCGVAPVLPQVRLSIIPAPVSVIAAPVYVIPAPVYVILAPVSVIPAKAGI